MIKLAGVSLIEMMLACVFGGLIASAIYHIYFLQQKTVYDQASIHQASYHAVKTVLLLTSEIERSGYIGCPCLQEGLPIKNQTNYLLTAKNKIELTSDSIKVRYAKDLQVKLTSMALGNKSIELAGMHPFRVGEVLLISDCQKAEIFQVANVRHVHDRQILEAQQPFSFQFYTDAKIMRMVMNQYFLLRHLKRGGDGSSSILYVEDIYRQRSPMVDGIDALNIHYARSARNKTAVAFAVSMQPPVFPKTWHGFATVPCA